MIVSFCGQDEVVTSRSKTVAVAVVAWKQLLQDMLVVPDPFVGVLNESSRCRYTVAIEAEPNTSTDECFAVLFVGRRGESPPGWGDIEQLGQHYTTVLYVFQRVITHTVTARNFDSIQRFSTLANNVTYMFSGG